MDVLDIDTNKVTVRPPKRFDESFVCKVDYNGEKRFSILFPSTECLYYSDKSSTAVLKPSSPKKVCKSIVALENVILEQVRTKAEDWFGDKIRAESFDSNFHSCAIIHPTAGNALKLRVISDYGNKFSEGTTYNIHVQLHGIKFKKNSFTLMWKVVEVKPLEPFLIDDDQDGYSVDEEEDVIDAIAVRSHLQEQLNQALDIATSELNAIQARVDELREQLEYLGTIKDVQELLKFSENISK